MCTFLNQIDTVCIEAISFSSHWSIHNDVGKIYSDMSYLMPKINEIEKDVRELAFKKGKITASSISEIHETMDKATIAASNSEDHLAIGVMHVLIFSVQDGFQKILNSRSNWIIPMRSHIESLRKSMRLLKGCLERLPKHEDFINFITSVVSLLLKIFSLVYSSYPKRLSQFKAKEIDSNIMDLIFAMKLIKAQFTLIEMLNLEAILSVSTKEQVEPLHTGLKFLIDYLIDLHKQNINHEKYNHRLKLIEVVASEAEYVMCSYFSNSKEDVNQLHPQLSLFLVKIKLIHAKVGLVSVLDRLNCKSGHMSHTMDSFETLQQEFEFLEILLVDLPKEYYKDEKPNNLVALIDEVALAIESIISSPCVKEMNVKMSREMNQCILGLLGKIEVFKIAYRENFPTESRSRFPKSHILGFIEILIEKIKDLLEYKPDLISTIENQIRIVQVELGLLITSLQGIFINHGRNEKLRSFWAHVADVAYEVENVIDSFISSKGGTFWKDMICIYVKEVNLLKVEAASINNAWELNDTPSLQYVDEASTAKMSIQVKALEMNEVVVGFEDEVKTIKEKLTNGRSKLDVISIVGMPGLGKTTLAKKIYDYYSTAKPCPFDVCSSCFLSQSYVTKNLLDILRSISDNLEELSKKSVDNLSDLLQKSLKGKKYLIFMDDIWSTDAWDDLKRLFPNEDNHSRIILMTRFEKVASYVTNGEPHHLRFFRLEESWSLLKQKLFHNESCPPELEEVGKVIAEKCRGLPFSIVLIAGLLKDIGKKKHNWESVANSFSSHNDTSLEIVELSYKHLPPHLKPCFLYFGGFREDEEVRVSKLIWLWLAEGFIQAKDQVIKSQELAYSYLKDLVDRSLVMKTNKTNDGKIC